MTEIKDLPDELLAEVLEYIEKTELINCVEVSEKWRQVIDRAIGIHMLVGNGTDIWAGDGERPIFEPVERVGEIGIVDCVFSQVVSDDVPTFRRCYLVKQLWFDGYISPENFNKLVAPLVNLRDLTIHITTLSVLPILDTWLVFPNLKTFMISQANIDRDDLQVLENLPLLLDNIVAFLMQAHYPLLDDLSLHLPYDSSREGAMVGAAIQAISRHKLTLKKLTISFEVRCHVPGQVLPIAFENKALHGLQLTRYIAHCIQPRRPIMAVFNNILASQQRLRKLHFTTGYVSFPTGIILRNARLLVAIEISLSTPTPPDPPIDLSIIRICNSLRLLTLFAEAKEQEFDENTGELIPTSSIPDIIGLTHLQNSVESVRICNLYMPKTDTAHIALNLVKLQILELRDIGTNGNLGLEFDTIMGLMNKKIIKSFSCGSSFNSDSLENALTRGDGGMTNFMACTMGILRNSSLIFNLDELHVYRTADSPEIIVIDEDLNVGFPVDDILNIFEDEDEEDDNGDEDNDENDDEENAEDQNNNNDGEDDEDNNIEEDNDGDDGEIDDEEDIVVDEEDDTDSDEDVEVDNGDNDVDGDDDDDVPNDEDESSDGGEEN